MTAALVEGAFNSKLGSVEAANEATVKPLVGKLGDRLTARGVEKQRAGRSGIYDITVTREDGTAIAEFRGHSRTIEGKILSGDKG